MLFGKIFEFLGLGSRSTGDSTGYQTSVPERSLVPGSRTIVPEAAMQISAVYSAVELLSKTIASLSLKVYVRDGANKIEDRDSQLAQVLRRPNYNQTSFDFWMTMGMNRFLRGNAYALITCDVVGGLVALRPLAADQVDVYLDDDGKLKYQYSFDGAYKEYTSDEILHWRGIGNGLVGMSTLDMMRATTTEVTNQQVNASAMFGNGSSLNGLMMVDSELSKTQIEEIKNRFSNLRPFNGGPQDFLHVLPASMRFQQLGMTAADAELLSSRKFSVDEIGRWFGVPSALLNSNEGSATAIESLTEYFYRSTIQPLVVSLEKLLDTKLVPPERRGEISCEFNMNALQRSNIETRYNAYAQALQNGFMTRNEARAMENLPLSNEKNADKLFAQSNLAPLDKLGLVDSSHTDQTPIQTAPIKQ